jgi:hypothetical protein
MEINVSEQVITEKSKPEIKQHFGQSFEIHKIKDGDLVPVGGNNMFSKELDMNVLADFSSFEDFFNDIHKKISEANLNNLRQKLDSERMDIDERLFSIIYAFSQQLGKKYLYDPDLNRPGHEEIRKNIYKDKEGKNKLSRIFDANVEECTDIALLAQGFLQREGVSSSYFGGEVLWNKNENYGGEPHSFIVIQANEKQYIYDPSNPMINRRFPSVYSIEKNFSEEINKNQKIFVTAENIRDKSEAYFGTGNQTAVLPEKHIV